MQFFKHFPQVPYAYQLDAGTFTLNITNLTAHVKIVERLQQHMRVFYDYIIGDGERPDTVAARLYGSPDYTWVVLVTNNILSLYDWPLSNEEFDRYVTDKYRGSAPDTTARAVALANAQSQVLYSTADGFRVDATTYALLPATDQGLTTTAYDDELRANEAKRRIKAIPAQFAAILMEELKTAMSN